jgi:hypothetical protein
MPVCAWVIGESITRPGRRGRYAFDATPERSRQALAEFAPAPGLGEIATLVDQAREAGTHVSYVVEGSGQAVPSGVSLTIYRIVQEALTNVRKHAGPGATAQVGLRYGPDEVSIRACDDGYGTVMEEGEPGHGLAGNPQPLDTRLDARLALQAYPCTSKCL